MLYNFTPSGNIVGITDSGGTLGKSLVGIKILFGGKSKNLEKFVAFF